MGYGGGEANEEHWAPGQSSDGFVEGERGPDRSLTTRPRREEAELPVEFLEGARASGEQETLLK